MKGEIRADQLRDRDVIVTQFSSGEVEYARVVTLRMTDHEVVCELSNSNDMQWQRTYERTDIVELA